MKKFLKQFCSAFIAISCVFSSMHLDADEEMVLLDADLADYDGKKVTLSGNVLVKHKLGTISAEQVVLSETPKTGKQSYNTVHMQGGVSIALNEGGKITCSQADVNYSKLQGVFSGTPDQEYVVYTENLASPGNEEISLIVKGRRMEMHMKNATQNVSKKSIESMVMEDAVTINYNHDLIAFADTAHYSHSPDQEDQRAGVITLKAAKLGGLCQLTNREGDVIRSNEMQIDTLNRFLTFFSPRGSLEVAVGHIEFTSDLLSWNEQTRTLTLDGSVEVRHQEMGTLKTENQIKIKQAPQKESMRLHSIESDSNTTLLIRDRNNHLRTLTCPGKIVLNHMTQQASLEGYQDQQIIMEDYKGEIFADKALIFYSESERGVVPNKIHLEGNVRILNHLTPSNQATAATLQYAIADELEYTPDTEEMLFRSKGENRVLFFDKVNNVQISAPGLKLCRDQITKKDSIQGLGDVRFSFVELEFEQLMQKFSLLNGQG